MRTAGEPTGIAFGTSDWAVGKDYAHIGILAHIVPQGSAAVLCVGTDATVMIPWHRIHYIRYTTIDTDKEPF